MGAIVEHRCNGAQSTSTVTIASNSLESLQASTCQQILMNNLGNGFGPRSRRLQQSGAPAPGDSRRAPNAFETLDPTVVIILVVLLFALICAAFFNSIMRCVLRRARGRRQRAAGTAGAGGRADQMAVEGLDPKTMASLPVLTFKAADESLCKESPAECTICLSDFSENEKIRLLPKCSHVFHLDCIDMWLLSHVSCPVCRDGIGDNNDEHSICMGTDVEQAPQGGGPISDQHDRSSGPAAAAVSGNATPNLRAELLPDSTERSSSDAASTGMHSQLPGQEATGSSRRSLRLTLSSIFAADRFLSGRWQASSSSAAAVAAPLTTPAPAATATS